MPDLKQLGQPQMRSIGQSTERKAGSTLFETQMFPPETLQELRALIVFRQVKVTSRVERVLRFALEHPAEIAFGTARGLASQCDVSNATIVRAALLFGFQNFHDFRELFRMEVRRARIART